MGPRLNKCAGALGTNQLGDRLPLRDYQEPILPPHPWETLELVVQRSPQPTQPRLDGPDGWLRRVATLRANGGRRRWVRTGKEPVPRTEHWTADVIPHSDEPSISGEPRKCSIKIAPIKRPHVKMGMKSTTAQLAAHLNERLAKGDGYHDQVCRDAGHFGAGSRQVPRREVLHDLQGDDRSE